MICKLISHTIILLNYV